MRQTGSREHLEVVADCHQFFLAPLDNTPVYDGRGTGPVVGVVDGCTALIVLTGCNDGIVHLTISLEDAPSPAEDSWEVQESVSIIIDTPVYIWAPPATSPDGLMEVHGSWNPEGMDLTGSVPEAAVMTTPNTDSPHPQLSTI